MALSEGWDHVFAEDDAPQTDRFFMVPVALCGAGGGGSLQGRRTKYEIYADNLLAECHIRATQPLASCGPWLGSRVSCPGRQDGKRPSNRPT